MAYFGEHVAAAVFVGCAFRRIVGAAADFVFQRVAFAVVGGGQEDGGVGFVAVLQLGADGEGGGGGGIPFGHGIEAAVAHFRVFNLIAAAVMPRYDASAQAAAGVQAA